MDRLQWVRVNEGAMPINRKQQPPTGLWVAARLLFSFHSAFRWAEKWIERNNEPCVFVDCGEYLSRINALVMNTAFTERRGPRREQKKTNRNNQLVLSWSVNEHVQPIPSGNCVRIGVFIWPAIFPLCTSYYLLSLILLLLLLVRHI